MAEEGNGAATARATMATLDARVQNLDRDYQDLKRTLLDLDSKIDSSITSLANRFENSISGLANKLEAKNTTQWPVIFAGCGVLLTVLIAVGTMAYLPIQRDTGRLDTAVSAILDRGVFQREYTADQGRVAETARGLRIDLNATVQQQRYNTDQERLTKTLEDVRASVEALRIRSYDSHGRLSKSEQSSADIDRRVDAISRRLAEFIRDTGRQPRTGQ